MTPKEYQIELKEKLQRIYPAQRVETEWTSIKKKDGLEDVYGKVYCPRVDVAVGPFATQARFSEEYNNLQNESEHFIEKLIEKHNENLIHFGLEIKTDLFDRLKYFNRNARCFLCIEIENKVSRKHLVGGLVNASALGRVGVLIPWTPEKLKAFVKLRNYLMFLGKVGKNTFKTENVLILTKEQLNDCF